MKLLRIIFFIKPLAKPIIQWVIDLDTRLLEKRLQQNPKNVNTRGYSSDKPINYFDLGTHKEASELKWVVKNVLSELPNPVKIFAFEANPESFKIASVNTQSIKNLELLNVALVKKVPESGFINLYIKGNGIGDSIYRTTSSSVNVEAKRLSQVITESNIDLSNSINIIRMNIEGCEFDVIKDLVESDMLKFFDGFYGMWDDVSKIDYSRDVKFRRLLKEVQVSPYPFNGRDMKHPNRLALIKKSLKLSILGRN